MTRKSTERTVSLSLFATRNWNAFSYTCSAPQGKKERIVLPKVRSTQANSGSKGAELAQLRPLIVG